MIEVSFTIVVPLSERLAVAMAKAGTLPKGSPFIRRWALREIMTTAAIQALYGKPFLLN